jgi:hypothetical protein
MVAVTTGAADVPPGVGLPVAGWLSARATDANRTPAAAENTNLFTMLPPETP